MTSGKMESRTAPATHGRLVQSVFAGHQALWWEDPARTVAPDLGSPPDDVAWGQIMAVEESAQGPVFYLASAETGHIDRRPWSVVRLVPGLNAEFSRAGEEPGGEDEEDEE